MPRAYASTWSVAPLHAAFAGAAIAAVRATDLSNSSEPRSRAHQATGSNASIVGIIMDNPENSAIHSNRACGNFSLGCHIDDTNGTSRSESSVAQVSPGPSQEPHFSFAYHKPALPLDRHDGMTFLLASVGLVIAASGGIGGGGILVPLFMLVLGFHPKHAIALSNFTILGGAIANTLLNSRKRHPQLERGLIDWDLILIMEPLTIFGAVFGSLLSKVLPNLVLTVSLVIVLAFMGHRTLKKGIEMWQKESKSKLNESASNVEMLATSSPLEHRGSITAEPDQETDSAYLELESDIDASKIEHGTTFKIATLTLCFVGTCCLTVLKGGGNFSSPLGFECGSRGFWLLYFGSLPWVLAFAAYFRYMLVSEFEHKARSGYTFMPGEVQWTPTNTVKYPAICAISGLLAGLFGVGGGIVKGPLMLEMGIVPAVASATAAAMILYTSAAASASFVVFGLLHPIYGAIFFVLGFVCTAAGQYSVGQWVKRYDRQSPIVLSIGLVITLSSVLVAINTLFAAIENPIEDLLRGHGVCSSET